MRILFVNPSCAADSGRDLYSAHITGPLFTGQPFSRMTLGMPLALPTLAARTPPQFEQSIVDEEIEPLNFDEPVDVVAITAMTFKASRAYEIAREFRARGVRVIMGGIHASMCPDEVAEHVDCVVLGEAESIWPSILADAAAGRLKARYEGGLADLKEPCIPRYDLVKNSRYLYAYLQTTRGCPFDCTFCTVTQMSGRIVRKKTPAQVIEEVRSVIGLEHTRAFRVVDRETGRIMKVIKMIAFIDDNFAIDRTHALAVCHALKRFQIEQGVAIPWYTQVNADIGFDDELLAAMEDAHCQHLFIGFESLDTATLRSMHKSCNSPERYAESIRNIHRHGIRVVFSTIVGDDNTTRESGATLKAFVEKYNLFHVLLNVLTPYPGTRMAEEMNRDGRILTRNPELYNIRNVVFRPKNMTAGRLQDLYRSLVEGIYRFGSMYRRGKSLLRSANRLSFPVIDRVPIWLGLSVACLLLAGQGKLHPRVAVQVLLRAPHLVLWHGTLYAVELLVTSADYDDFARSEKRRADSVGI